jgi:hypothetical protein
MVSVEDIYAKTSNGLDIILFFYPQARECLSGRQKHFRIREGDHTPSATLKELKGVWKVTDFGDAGRAMSPIDICMQEKGLSFTESIFYLAREFNIDGENITPEINKPDIRTRAATEDEAEGCFIFEGNDRVSDSELALLGPRVKEESFNALGWISVKQYSITKNRKTTTIISNENYPIFMRKCLYLEGNGKSEAHFYKIYQPLNPNKAFRFFYHGAKPQKYVNGLFELEKTYRKHNDQRRRDMINSGELDEHDTYKYEKLPEAFICSGERDAICIHALGYNPLWFNSETYNLSENEFREISKYVEKIYNIPDIDDTGTKKGIELASRFIDVYTVWLPDKLRTYRDRRGKPRKDFRDFCEIWPEKDRFRGLLNMAMPFRFWEWKRNEKGQGQGRLELITEYAMHFLRCNGFACIEDKNSKSGKMFVHIRNNIVREIKAKDIRAFFRRFVRERELQLDIRDLVNNTTRLSEQSLDNLDEITLDFCNYTPYSQFFFFRNAIWEATGEQVIEHKASTRYVWEDELIDHHVKRLEPVFTISDEPDENGVHNWNIEISENNKSNFFKFLINSSRIHWRRELEYKGDRMTDEQMIEYREKYKFAIDGTLLSPEEIDEQKHHLVNKIFALGYLLHHYKAENRSWCVFAMDNKEGSDDESNGGTGKSFCFKTPRLFMKSVTLSGRNPKLITENKHAFENVTEHTKYILVDDSNKYTPFEFFFDVITGDITVNPKNTKSYTIPFEHAPKFCITSNFTLRNIDSSTARRVLYAVFSDYYHEKTDDNDYIETRTIFDDFDKNLFREKYSEEEWNADINFLVECCRFYLSVINRSVKLQPPMGNVTIRNLRGVMGDDFLEWAKIFFSKESGNRDRLIPRSIIYEDFKISTGIYQWKANRFSKCMKAFAQYDSEIIALNPEILCNDGNRIVKRISGKESPVECYYVQTKEEINYEFDTEQKIEHNGLQEVKLNFPF